MRATTIRWGATAMAAFAFVTVAWAVTTSNKPGTKPKVGTKPAAQDDGFVVHEWGTFTTFSGADGIHLDFRPLDVAHSDLPGFVVDRAEWSGRRPMFKSAILARVRMETPVAYFYTEKPRTVRVGVEFPDGLLTEFYPPVRSQFPKFNPTTAYREGEKMGGAKIDWGDVDLIPTSAFRPQIADQEMADHLQQLTIDRILPDSNSHPHYRYARETDAALVHVNLPKERREFSGRHLEKFLFYRGVGKFKLPIQVVFDKNGQASLVNDGKIALGKAIVIQVQGKRKAMAVIDAVGAEASVPLPEAQAATEQQIAEQVRQALVEQGLYEKEAAAMVATWQDSWFTEEGTRVLYSVPAPTTEKLLPLHVSPQPREMVRVLIGRLEVMSPEMETRLAKLVAENAVARQVHYQTQSAKVKAAKERGEQVNVEPFTFPAELAKLDRFAEPALARILATATNSAIRNEATALIHELRRQ